MRTLLSVTGVSVLILSALIGGPAIAGRNAGGVMALHVDNSLVYSVDADYCGDTPPSAPLPPTCLDLVTEVMVDPTVDAIIWMVASFPRGSSPGVNAYQVGMTGDLTGEYFDAHGPCGPSPIEIPDSGWPGMGYGTAVFYTSTVHSQLFKMYWFACGAWGVGSSMGTTNYYGGDHHAEWEDDSNPPVIDYCRYFGTVVWGGPGGNDCPVCCGEGACCFLEGSCQDLSQADCGAAGGIYEGEGTACSSYQCPQPQGACCFCDGSCQDLMQTDCIAAGGAYQGDGTTCAMSNCAPPPGACCFPDGSCFLTAECECDTGDWRQGESCDPNPCQPTPTKVTTWGSIKGGFR